MPSRMYIPARRAARVRPRSRPWSVLLGCSLHQPVAHWLRHPSLALGWRLLVGGGTLATPDAGAWHREGVCSLGRRAQRLRLEHWRLEGVLRLVHCHISGLLLLKRCLAVLDLPQQRRQGLVVLDVEVERNALRREIRSPGVGIFRADEGGQVIYGRTSCR